jgi:hypothetical protein
MKYFTPIEGELIISESNDNQILLTNKRIRQLVNGEYLTSIMLDKVSVISAYRFHFLMLLIAGLVLLAMGGLSIATERDQELGVALIFVGLVLAILYWFTRKHVITITSDSGVKLMFRTRGMNQETIFKFINQIEDAKLKYTSKP